MVQVLDARARFRIGLFALPMGTFPVRSLVVTLLATAACWAAGCRIADPTVPEWVEAHGRGQIIALSADAEGAIAVGSNRRIYIYPGPFMQPWQERFNQEAVAIAAGGGVVAWVAPDGAVRLALPNLPVRELPGSREWHASALGVGPDGNLFVVTAGRVWAVAADALGEPLCDGAVAMGVAPAGASVYVWRADGTVVARVAGQCQPVSVPFPVANLAASGAELAAVDRQGQVWRRRAGSWQALPRPRIYRPDQFPYEPAIRAVAMTPMVLWGRTDDGLALILSDPT